MPFSNYLLQHEPGVWLEQQIQKLEPYMNEIVNKLDPMCITVIPSGVSKSMNMKLVNSPEFYREAVRTIFLEESLAADCLNELVKSTYKTYKCNPFRISTIVCDFYADNFLINTVLLATFENYIATQGRALLNIPATSNELLSHNKLAEIAKEYIEKEKNLTDVQRKWLEAYSTSLKAKPFYPLLPTKADLLRFMEWLINTTFGMVTSALTMIATLSLVTNGDLEFMKVIFTILLVTISNGLTFATYLMKQGYSHSVPRFKALYKAILQLSKKKTPITPEMMEPALEAAVKLKDEVSQTQSQSSTCVRDPSRPCSTKHAMYRRPNAWTRPELLQHIEDNCPEVRDGKIPYKRRTMNALCRAVPVYKK